MRVRLRIQTYPVSPRTNDYPKFDHAYCRSSKRHELTMTTGFFLTQTEQCLREDGTYMPQVIGQLPR